MKTNTARLSRHQCQPVSLFPKPHVGLRAAAALLLLTASVIWAQNARDYPLGDIPLTPVAYANKLAVFSAEAFEALPASYDARSLGIVTPAKDQGGCGSCWAFASVGAMESHLLLTSAAGPTDLSEQQQVSCNTSQFGCSGGSASAIRFWETTGPVTETCFPYTAKGTTTCSYSCSAMDYRVVNWHTLNNTVADFKASCYNQGPSYWRFDVYSDFFNYWDHGTAGQVYRNTGGTMQGGHAVLLIGWDDVKGAFLCKNSWGRTRGPNGDGTFWIAYSNHANNLGFGMVNFDVVAVGTLGVSTFAVNNEAASTTARTVTLNNTSTGNPTEFVASESASFSDGAWQPYSTAPTFTLSSGSGTKTVYFKVRNATAQSAVVSDTIQYVETVPLGDALNAPGLSWSTGGSAGWTGQSTVTHDGSAAATSGTLSDSQESWVQTTLTGPGTVSFWWKVSSESGWDYLRVQVDGTELANISGEVDWQQRTLMLGTGTHTVRWSYTKDMSLSRGADHGWLDQVLFTATPLPPTDVVYVDWRSTCPVTDGSSTCPHRTAPEGYAQVASGGKVRVSSGTYAFPGRVLSKVLTLESLNGVVLLSASGATAAPEITAALPTLQPPVRRADGTLAMQFQAIPGQHYQILSSTNLKTWVVWKDFTAETEVIELVHPPATNEPYRFFTVRIP